MRILIIEDEPSAAKRLQKMLRELEPTTDVVGVIETIQGTVDWFKGNEPPDLAFFDIQLADGESFLVFDRVDVPCPVIFTTAYDEHALRAFKVNALDYLLKPVGKDELRDALDRWERMHVVRDKSGLVGGGDTEAAAPIKRFLIRYGDHFRVVEPKDIAYIYSMEKSTFLRTIEGKDLPMDESLDRLEKQLDPEKFYRINRQVIIHFQCIKELLAYSKSRVKVIMDPPFGQDAVVSSERSADFKRWLAGSA
ncbi:MAG: response regulator transcription factor [Flavobacteriales bacterium]|nr:response regulator transcription factor [Flavobacteriales bacterium]MCB9168509.1 response regulator transcription factor [Flavobacteriales bacterium]